MYCNEKKKDHFPVYIYHGSYFIYTIYNILPFNRKHITVSYHIISKSLCHNIIKINHLINYILQQSSYHVLHRKSSSLINHLLNKRSSAVTKRSLNYHQKSITFIISFLSSSLNKKSLSKISQIK